MDNTQTPSRKSLVLVVGAGASHEAGLPLGSELKKRIAEILRVENNKPVDNIIDNAFNLIIEREYGSDKNKQRYSLVESAKNIHAAMPLAISIDNFIDAHRSNPLTAQCGKLAIVRSILQAEAKSQMIMQNGRLDFSSLENTWYNAFFQLLTENCQWNDLPNRFSQVAIICFNYDRCIQHYLLNALQTYYGIGYGDSSTILLHLEFHHPYGMVGLLPWMNSTGSIDFGATPSEKQLIEFSNQIKTFTEGSNEGTSDIIKIRELLDSAERIVFLGFAFHKLNYDLLFPPKDNVTFYESRKIKHCKVFATGVGLSTSDIAIIIQWLSMRRIDTTPHMSLTNIKQGITCANLFEEFRKSLSFSS